MNIISQDELKEILNYDPLTGLFTWKVKLSDKVNLGGVAGSVIKGYIIIRINGKRYAAHKLAWLYMYNHYTIFPKENIDHIDGVRNNNRIDNLRIATTSQNGQNLKVAHRDNMSTGLLGAYSHKNGSFYSIINVKGKQKNLGYFKTPLEAHNAYIKVKREMHEFNTL